MINIGLLGLGTVGTGVVEILDERQKELEKLLGEKIRIKKILVNDIHKARTDKAKDITITSDFEDILNDKDISIVIEVTGDIEKSYSYIKESLNKGKHIVTANKGVVSKHFEEFSDLAYKKGLAFLYEASVGGGIPVLKPLKEGISLNEITEVQGILNGTCNYILTRMVKENKDYEEVLRMAQELGYAEADPSSDVEGDDTLRKLRILGTLALQGTINEEDIILGGINNILSYDIDKIKSMDSTIKLIGEAKIVDEGFTAMVQPTIIKNDSYFANVNMAYNSIAFSGDNVGELKFYGSGAGKLPTANAVLSDVLDIAGDSYKKINPLGDRIIKNANETIKGKYYLRIKEVDDKIREALEEKIETYLDREENLAIITKEIYLEDIESIILSLELKKDRYLLARVLD